MKLKFFIIIIFVLIFSGCSCDYKQDIVIDNSKNDTSKIEYLNGPYKDGIEVSFYEIEGHRYISIKAQGYREHNFLHSEECPKCLLKK